MEDAPTMHPKSVASSSPALQPTAPSLVGPSASNDGFVSVVRNSQKRPPSKGAAHPIKTPHGVGRQKKTTNLVVGKKVVEGLVSWRGADLTTELYIGNVSVGVSLEDAKTAITELGVKVVEMEVAGKHNHFQSFRLRIKKIDLEKVKNPDFWPDGIVVRRFYRPRRDAARNSNHNNNIQSGDGNAITTS